MEKEILSEIKQLRADISKLIGTSELQPKDQFSKEALDKAAKQFQKLSIERGEWIEEYNISRYIKNAHYRAGAFIRQEFGFSNYFKRGQTYYYNKKDLIALAKELKARNVDLGRYMEYIEDQAKFKKYLESANENGKGKKKRKSFQLPYDLKDIITTPAKAPSVEAIREDLKKLKEEFFQFNLSDYIDIYKGNHAMMKFIYHYQKYLEPDLKKRCKRWCENFNYANHALELVTKKKEVFIPVKEDDMIQL
jgi:hypothetical protein